MELSGIPCKGSTASQQWIVLFYHLLSEFVSLTKYFEAWEKSKVAVMTFKVSKTETQKQITFLKWPIINEYS